MHTQTVVSLVMSPNHPTDDLLHHVDAAVKLFLSFVEELDNNIVKDNENKIESASCFVNLLGLKDIMTKFGVLRNFWEEVYVAKGSSCLSKIASIEVFIAEVYAKECSHNNIIQ